MTPPLALNTLLLAGMLAVGLLAHFGRATEATLLLGFTAGLSLGGLLGRWRWPEPHA